MKYGVETSAKNEMRARVCVRVNFTAFGILKSSHKIVEPNDIDRFRKPASHTDKMPQSISSQNIEQTESKKSGKQTSISVFVWLCSKPLSVLLRRTDTSRTYDDAIAKTAIIAF